MQKVMSKGDFVRKQQGVKEEDPKQPGASPVIRIAIQATIGQSRIMTFETFCDQLTPKEVIDKLSDTLMRVADRQTKYYEMVDLKNMVLKEEHTLRTSIQNYERIAKENAPLEIEGRRNKVEDKKKSTELLNMARNIEIYRERIQAFKDDLAVRELEFKDL